MRMKADRQLVGGTPALMDDLQKMHRGVEQDHARLIHIQLLKLEERIQCEITRQDKSIEFHLQRIYKCLGFRMDKETLVRISKEDKSNQAHRGVAASGKDWTDEMSRMEVRIYAYNVRLFW